MYIRVRICVQSVHHQHAHVTSVTTLVNHSVDNVLVKVKPSLNREFSHVVDIVNLCFIHALVYITPKLRGIT